MSERAQIRLEFERRATRYAQLDRDPRIHVRTRFFEAASTVTRVIGGGDPTHFMARLSAALEIANTTRAMHIGDGRLYAGGCWRSNTVDFVRFEQGLVQKELEALQAEDPFQYAAEVDAADWGFARMSVWCSRFRSAAHRRLHFALRSARETLGRAPQFARQGDRESIGIAIASLWFPSDREVETAS